jgi:MerR family transcriptional regulator, light-induced transcriptional regulator
VAGTDLADGRAGYAAALAAGDARSALAVVDGLIDAGIEFDDLCEQVIRPALYDIGDMWASRHIGVADEHLASSISETVLALIGVIWAAPVDARPRVLVCATEGEAHALGARMVAESFAASDWAVRFLGASTPPDAVAAAVVEHEIDVMALSTTMTSNLQSVAETIELARSAAPDLVVIVGGQAYGGDEQIAGRLGADAYGDGLRGLVQSVEERLARAS